MSRKDSPYSDEPNETDAYPPGDGDDDTDTESADARSSPEGTWSWGWPSDYWWSAGEEVPDSVPAGKDDSWLDEGLFAFLIVVGLLLFVVPEPGTSVVGILFMVAGAIAWLFDTVTETGI